VVVPRPRLKKSLELKGTPSEVSTTHPIFIEEADVDGNVGRSRSNKTVSTPAPK